MLKLKNNSIGLGLKVMKRGELDCSDIVNEYWCLSDKVGFTWYSTNLRVDSMELPRIKVLYLFGTTVNGEQFVVEAEVLKIIKRKTEFIPIEVNEDEVPEVFRGEEKKLWLKLGGFKQIEVEDSNFNLAYKVGTLRDKVITPGRSNMFYVNID